MDALIIVGFVNVAIGIIMVVFRNSLGVCVCKLGKSIFKSSPFNVQDMIESVYDEKKAPKVFLFLGIVFIIQSSVFFIAGYFVDK